MTSEHASGWAHELAEPLDRAGLAMSYATAVVRLTELVAELRGGWPHTAPAPGEGSVVLALAELYQLKGEAGGDARPRVAHDLAEALCSLAPLPVELVEVEALEGEELGAFQARAFAARPQLEVQVVVLVAAASRGRAVLEGEEPTRWWSPRSPRRGSLLDALVVEGGHEQGAAPRARPSGGSRARPSSSRWWCLPPPPIRTRPLPCELGPHGGGLPGLG